MIGGQAGGVKYIVHNILFKFALDKRDFYGSDAAAAKVAGHELQGLISLFNCDEVGLCMPLMALVDYKGFRLIAISTLPVNSETLCYGTCDGGRTIHGGTDNFNRRVAGACVRGGGAGALWLLNRGGATTALSRTINVKAHYCGTEANKVLMYSACDLEGHIGLDNKLYLLDFSRVMPPERPTVALEGACGPRR